MTHQEYMQEALREARASVDVGSAPFAVVVVDPSGEIVWRDHDRVKEYIDPTAHAEINAIRALCKKMQSLSLSELTFYTTSEPCATCFSAMIKSRVRQCYFGAKIETTASLPISVEVLLPYATKYPIAVVGGILEEECLAQRTEYYV